MKLALRAALCVALCSVWRGTGTGAFLRTLGRGFGAVELLEQLAHSRQALHDQGVSPIHPKGPQGHQQRAGSQGGAGAQHPSQRTVLHRQLVGKAVQSVLHRLEKGRGNLVHAVFLGEPFPKLLFPLEITVFHDAPPFPAPVPHRPPGISSARGTASVSRRPH